MLGVGDSDVDLPFLATAGSSAAPANASPAHSRALGLELALQRFDQGKQLEGRLDRVLRHL
jgi:3-deoxy-D-manno-octulosonate 8-phosphate phosphatase KdsC-like HAD superfamily phosphatase